VEKYGDDRRCLLKVVQDDSFLFISQGCANQPLYQVSLEDRVTDKNFLNCYPVTWLPLNVI
jgi:hypothetical protein